MWIVWSIIAAIFVGGATCGALWFFNQSKVTRLEVSQSEVYMNGNGGTADVTVDCDGEWEITKAAPEWATVTRAGNVLTFTFAENNGDRIRRDFITIKSGDFQKNIDLVEGLKRATYINITPSHVDVPGNGGTFMFTVDCDGDWEVGIQPYDWGHLSRTGNNTLTLVVDPNDETYSRDDWFTVQGTGNNADIEARVDIEQAPSTGDNNNTPVQRGTYITCNPQSVSFGAQGGTKTFTVNASGNWTISTNTYSWGHLTKQNSTTLTLRVDANTSSDQRTDWFVLDCNGQTCRVNITQAGTNNTNAFISCSPSSLRFSGNGGTQTISVSASGSWDITTDTYSWGHLTKVDDSTLRLRVDANPNSSERTDWFVLTCGGQTSRVNITQEGGGSPVGSGSFTITPTNVNFSAQGGTKTFTVNAPGTWEVTTDTYSWGHLTKQNNSTLTLRVDANTSGSQRTDWFVITCGSQTCRVDITQAGGSSGGAFTVTPSSVHFGASGGTKTFTVSAPGDWDISTDTYSWGHLTKQNNTTLTLRVDANSGSARTDWFVLNCNGNTVRVNISQD